MTAESTSTTPAGQEVERLRREIERQCSIGAGTFTIDDGFAQSGLWQISADLDPRGLKSALATPSVAIGAREVERVAKLVETTLNGGGSFDDVARAILAPASASTVKIGAGEVACPKCGGDWCSVDLCLPATPSKAWSTSAAVEQKSWTGDPHGLANELRRCANLWREGFRLPQLLRDAADEIDCLAPGGTPASASIPADVERGVRADDLWVPRSVYEGVGWTDGRWGQAYDLVEAALLDAGYVRPCKHPVLHMLEMEGES